MSEVKRYGHQTHNGRIWFEDINEGKYCLYKDYAALQQKLDAVLAENLRLNEMYRRVVKELDDTCCEMGMMAGEKSMEYPAPETPATDAALNAVRADAVDDFGKYHNFSGKLFIQEKAKKYAAKLRAETDTTSSQYESLAGGK